MGLWSGRGCLLACLRLWVACLRPLRCAAGRLPVGCLPGQRLRLRLASSGLMMSVLRNKHHESRSIESSCVGTDDR